MIIITVDGGAITGVYLDKKRDNLVAVVDFFDDESGENPVSVFHAEDLDEVPEEGKTLLNRHQKFVKLNGGKL